VYAFEENHFAGIVATQGAAAQLTEFSSLNEIIAEDENNIRIDVSY
jgi:hypothetical protein